MDEVDRRKQQIYEPDTDAWNKQMYKIRVFDQLVYDNDPNLTNVLIGQNWEIYRVDFSRSFRTKRDLRNPEDLVKCDRHQRCQELRRLFRGPSEYLNQFQNRSPDPTQM